MYGISAILSLIVIVILSKILVLTDKTLKTAHKILIFSFVFLLISFVANMLYLGGDTYWLEFGVPIFLLIYVIGSSILYSSFKKA